jgi:uncharacterized 2Fe-2S/4Fe-4S cluster protein (DUF4445 family)
MAYGQQFQTSNFKPALCAITLHIMSDIKGETQRTALIIVKDIGSFEVLTGSNLRETLRQEGVYLDGTCADKGSCGRCVVRILAGEAGQPSSQETELLPEGSSDPGCRLACRVSVSGHMDISVDRERILEIDRTGRWKEVWGSPLWHPELITLDQEGYGLAVDMGTTSIATCLLDLSTARPLDIKAAANPQLPWGDEIISRLGLADENAETARQLNSLVWQTVNEQLRSLCLRNGVSRGRIRRMVVVGNSAMHHLCLGLPLGKLLTPPYDPEQTGSITLSAGELPVKLDLPRQAEIYFPPLVGGFAGSDILASTMAVQSQGVNPGAVMDVGTNTEIAIFSGDKVYVATAPSGPAFEGGHIPAGMRAEPGAIWKVALANGKITYEVIGDIPPDGICGSGIVDALSVMLEIGAMETSGLIQEGSHSAVQGGRMILDDNGKVVLYGEDVATVQKAKAAVAATWHILLNKLGLDEGDLQTVYLAGAFGTRLDPVNAVKIGILPPMDPQRFVLAGNTALLGAAMILLSGEIQERTEAGSRDVTHISVAEEPDFEEQFLSNLYFPERENKGRTRT